MSKSFIGVMALGCIALIGCGKEGTPGGPGATSQRTGSNVPLTGEADNSFRLDMPMLSTSLKQGEAKIVAIGIKRGTNFDQDVTLKFGELPKGLTIDPASPVIKHGDKEVKVTIKAADDAAIGDFTIKVTGHPAKGADATAELKINITKK